MAEGNRGYPKALERRLGASAHRDHLLGLQQNNQPP